MLSTLLFVPAVECKIDERLIYAVIAGLFQAGKMLEGSLIDAGANNGATACTFALLDSHRTVHAIEPMPQNIEYMTREYRLPNLAPLHGGLGGRDEEMSLSVPKGQLRRVGGQVHNMKQGKATHPDKERVLIKFPVYRVDTLFFDGAWKGERLAFAHFDVEGSEVEVLAGAARTIARDQPVFTVEAMVNTRATGPTGAIALLRAVEKLGYDAFLIEESCGTPVDCRNILCLPRSRAHSFMNVPVLDVAVIGRRLLAVNESTITSQAYPCCNYGGECCPVGGARGTCCSAHAVAKWLKSQTAHTRGVSGVALRSEASRLGFMSHARMMAFQAAEQAFWNPAAPYSGPAHAKYAHAMSA